MDQDRWMHPERERQICIYRQKPVRLQYYSRDPEGYVFCVRYAGNGHYYRELDAAVAYMKRRKFMKKSETITETEFLK